MDSRAARAWRAGGGCDSFAFCFHPEGSTPPLSTITAPLGCGPGAHAVPRRHLRALQGGGGAQAIRVRPRRPTCVKINPYGEVPPRLANIAGMPDTRTLLSTLLYGLWWPASSIIYAIHAVLSPFWTALQFVLLPVTCLVRAVLAIVLLPFRLNILDRFEVLPIPLSCQSRTRTHQKHGFMLTKTDYIHMARHRRPHRVHRRSGSLLGIQDPHLRTQHRRCR